MKTTALILIIACLPSCIVTTRPDGSTTRAVDGPAVVTVVDQYFRIRAEK